ncbi:MAG: hypothetical protein I3274_02600 [Candidatus Moeniiplasma glomeromycotorum]|nr:hypothetical protein [Candidatus Moeniiplasma glomeromycotorum]MCE8167494.1 hypothetical protein [Candidatus Moeniiplasma glomeromycotorum]
MSDAVFLEFTDYDPFSFLRFSLEAEAPEELLQVEVSDWILGDFSLEWLDYSFTGFGVGVKGLGSSFKSGFWRVELISTGVLWVSVGSSSLVINLSSVESEGDKKEGAVGLATFKVGFDFVFETGVEFFLLGVEELEVSAVLSILGAVVSGNGRVVSGAVDWTARLRFLGVRLIA